MFRLTKATLIFIMCLFLSACGSLSTSNKELFEKTALSAEEIYEQISPSVVEITAESINEAHTGTGFFYDTEGTVITNYHVIENCTTASITLSNGDKYRVEKVLGYNEYKDIAILSTALASSVPIEIRDTELKTGETVYAIGSSLGLTGSLSNGIISSAEREVDDQFFIQTTAPISNGNSGGPLLDTSGKVIGITTASFSDGQNLNLAIPISAVKNISIKNPILLSDLFSNKDVYPDAEGYAEGTIGDVMHTYFFDFVLNGANICERYENYIPMPGYELLVANVTIKNTFTESIQMYDTDFQVQWGDDENDDAFDVPVTFYIESDKLYSIDMLPGEYNLEVNSSRTGLLVFEIPEGERNLSISYVECFADDSRGDVFFVYFTIN